MSTQIGNPYISSSAADATGPWIDLWLHQWDGKNDVGVSFHFEETGSTGTIFIDGSNDPRCALGHPDGANAQSDDISASITSPAIPTVTGAGDGFINISNFRMRFIRYRWDYSATAGVHTVYAYVT